MKSKIAIVMVAVLALGLLAFAVGCPRKAPPPVVTPPPPPPPVVTPTAPAPPSIPIPSFNEDVYVEIAAYIEYLRWKYPGEENAGKVSEELIKFVKKYGFNVKDDNELTDAMIEMSNQMDAISREPSKPKYYTQQIEEKVRTRLNELKQDDTQQKQTPEPKTEPKPAEQKAPPPPPAEPKPAEQKPPEPKPAEPPAQPK